MIIVIDIDGVIAQENENNYIDYSSVELIKGAKNCIEKLINEGHHIILYTARLECDRQITEGWLYLCQIPYHELHFGKPYADIYIDDKALKFNNWNQIELEFFGEKNG